jgi:transmembrane sensor
VERPAKTLLVAYFAGTLPEQDRSIAEDYIASGKDTAYIQACMETAWHQTTTAGIHYLPDHDAWDKFRERTGIAATVNMAAPVQQPLQRSSRLIFLWAGVAAAVTLLLGIGYTFFVPRTQPAPVSWTMVTGTPMLIKKVQLPDGSSITLFPGASIRYNNAYNQHERTILLQGRAFFDVATAAGKPFLVKTGQYTTQVLGTRFEIQEESVRQQLSLILQSGKVQLLAAGKPLGDLHPGEQLLLHTGNGQFNIHPVAENATAWVTGELSYEQTDFGVACRELEAWYGVQITIHRPELLHKHITASFHRMSLKNVLDILSQTARFSWKQDQQHIDIY